MSALSYIGHSTVLVELDGARLLTDPVIRKRVAHLRRATSFKRAALEDLDAVLVSHAHRDHLDLPSLEDVGRSATIVVPRGVGGLLRRRGFQSVLEVEEGDELTFGEVTVRATYAEHEGRRRPGKVEGPALGYALLGTQRLYFAGDTGLFPAMSGLVTELDVALLPIWGWGATLGRGLHLDPATAAEALALLKPRMAIPIHWGTYHPWHHGVRRVPAFLRDPANAFVQEAARVAPEVAVRVLEPGERLSLEASA
jgi:L-ascorbate metabolism protein UlaG (beta-lactamase superfamily)